MKYTPAQKLWKVIKERDEYYYEIRLAGNIIDRVRIEEPTLKYLKQEEVINGE